MKDEGYPASSILPKKRRFRKEDKQFKIITNLKEEDLIKAEEQQKMYFNPDALKEVRENFDMAMRMAETIGFADKHSHARNTSSFIDNSPIKKERTRRCNRSDLISFQRQQESEKVRKRYMLQHVSAVKEVQPRNRKGSIRSVFIEPLKPYQDPFSCIKNQKMILRNDRARAKKSSQENQLLNLISWEKERRSKILEKISDGMITLNECTKSRRTSQNKYFGQQVRKVKRPETISQQKLSASIDFNKFQLVTKGDQLSLHSRELSTEMRSQTARREKRSMYMHFNASNKVEMLYPKSESESQL